MTIQLFFDAYGARVPADLSAMVAERQLRDLALVADLARRGIEPADLGARAVPRDDPPTSGMDRAIRPLTTDVSA